MVILIFPTRPHFVIAGSPFSPAMLIFSPHFQRQFSKVETLLVSCLSSSWNQHCNISFSLSFRKSYVWSITSLYSQKLRDFSLKFYFSFPNQLLVQTKSNEKNIFQTSTNYSDVTVISPDTEACLTCWPTACCICRRYFHSLLFPGILPIIQNCFSL